MDEHLCTHSTSYLDFADHVNSTEVSMFKLRKNHDLIDSGKMIVESERIIRRALSRGIKFHSLIVLRTMMDRVKDVLDQLDPKCLVYLADNQTLESFLGGRVHQTMMGLAERPNISNQLNLTGHAVLLNGIEDPQNLGSIIRNYHAFGIESVILDSESIPGFRNATK